MDVNLLIKSLQFGKMFLIFVFLGGTRSLGRNELRYFNFCMNFSLVKIISLSFLGLVLLEGSLVLNLNMLMINRFIALFVFWTSCTSHMSFWL